MQKSKTKTQPGDAKTLVRRKKPLTDLTPTRKQDGAVKGGLKMLTSARELEGKATNVASGVSKSKP